ncbi:MAG: hypothetical protein AAFQ43_03945 [Bacteroidota bacterium]
MVQNYGASGARGRFSTEALAGRGPGLRACGSPPDAYADAFRYRL